MRRMILRLFFVILLFSIFPFTSCTPAKIETRSKGVMLKDETVVHYLEAGQGPALILIHGLGSSSDAWRSCMPSLSRSYRVLALDLPGFGKSDKPKADYSLQYQAGVVKEFMAAVGADKAALAGNSLGGWIAALVALDSPGKVSALILVDSAGLRQESPVTVNLNPSTKEEQKALLLALFANKSLVTDEIVEEQWQNRKEIRGAVQATMDSFKTAMPLLDDRLKDIKIPTLVIWGKEDTLVPPAVGERFAKGISGSKLVVIENAGHLPQIEQPEAFARSVKGFVKNW